MYYERPPIPLFSVETVNVENEKHNEIGQVVR